MKTLSLKSAESSDTWAELKYEDEKTSPPFINTAQQQEASSARPTRNVLHRSALFISCQSFFLSDKSTWKHNNTNVVQNHLTGPRLNCLFLIPLALKKKKEKSVNQSQFRLRNSRDKLTRARLLSMRSLDGYNSVHTHTHRGSQKHNLHKGYALNDRKGEGIQPD